MSFLSLTLNRCCNICQVCFGFCTKWSYMLYTLSTSMIPHQLKLFLIWNNLSSKRKLVLSIISSFIFWCLFYIRLRLLANAAFFGVFVFESGVDGIRYTQLCCILHCKSDFVIFCLNLILLFFARLVLWPVLCNKRTSYSPQPLISFSKNRRIIVDCSKPKHVVSAGSVYWNTAMFTAVWLLH